MKKILILLAIVIAVMTFLPLTSKAAPAEIGGGIVECCQLRHDVTIAGAEQVKTTILGPVADQTKTNCPFGVPTLERKWAAYCTVDIIMTVSDWIFWLALTIGAIMIVVAAIMFVTSGGSPDKTGKAKGILTYAVIGFVVALLAKFIPAIAKYFIGV